MSFLTMGSSKRRPIRRLMAYRVLDGLVTAWRFADCPTSRSPFLAKATMEGVVRAPSAFSMTRVSLPSMMATQELVVPRSMPMTLLIRAGSFAAGGGGPPIGAAPVPWVVVGWVADPPVVTWADRYP